MPKKKMNPREKEQEMKSAVHGNRKHVQRGLDRLMGSPELMGIVEDLASTGASIATIEAACGIPVGLLSKWLNKGKTQPKTMYRTLFNLFRKWVSESRHAAESKMVDKAPAAWLEKNTSSRLLDSPEDIGTSLIPTNSNISNSPSLIQMGAQQAIDAIRILHQSGISIDETLKKNELTVTPLPITTKEDIS